MHWLHVLQNTDSFSACSLHLSLQAELDATSSVSLEQFVSLLFRVSSCWVTSSTHLKINRLNRIDLHSKMCKINRTFSIIPAIYQLMNMQWCSTMRTLRPLLCQPSSNAQIATQFTTMGAKVSVPQSFHANETSKHIGQRFDCRIWISHRRMIWGHIDWWWSWWHAWRWTWSRIWGQRSFVCFGSLKRASSSCGCWSHDRFVFCLVWSILQIGTHIWIIDLNWSLILIRVVGPTGSWITEIWHIFHFMPKSFPSSAGATIEIDHKSRSK